MGSTSVDFVADSLESLSFVSPPDAAELMGSMERDSVLSNEGDVLDTDLEEEEKGIFSKPGMQMYAVNSHTSEGTLEYEDAASGSSVGSEQDTEDACESANSALEDSVCWTRRWICWIFLAFFLYWIFRVCAVVSCVEVFLCAGHLS